MKHISEIQNCPFCGYEEYYKKETYKGTCNAYARFDGKETENGDMYSYASHKLSSKFAYCTACNRKIARL